MEPAVEPVTQKERLGRRLRVVLVAFDSAELCIRLASALADHVEPILLLPEHMARPHLKLLDDRVRFIPFEKPRLRHLRRQLTTIRRVRRTIRELRPDIVHFQKGHLWFNLSLLRPLGVPFVISIHDPTHHLGDESSRHTPQWLMHFAYRRADHVLAHNEAMAEEIVAECGIPRERIDVVPLIERGDRDLGRPLDEEPGTILFFGRIWEYKGLQHLIQAEPLISSRIPEAKIIIGGRGEDFEPYRRAMSDPSRFEVHNEFVSVEKRAELFRRACVVALPYVEATQSGVIPVAYTHGKPVVATQVGGLASQVDDGETGFLVPPGDSTALADRIATLLEDEPLRRRLGENGRRKLEREWAGAVVAERTAAVYRRVLEEHARGTGEDSRLAASQSHVGAEP